MDTQRSERGQALVLIVLAIIVILGFVALAVDGGRVFAERRRAQNAADSSALAAAFTNVNGGTSAQAVANGVARAASNGFDNNGTTNTVQIFNPPQTGPYAGRNDYFQAVVHSHVDIVFAQFVYHGGLELTTEAVARGKVAGSISSGNTLHSLSQDPDSMVFNGNVGVTIDGGNIFSNGGLTKTGASGGIKVKKGDALCAGVGNDKHGVISPALACGESNNIYPEMVPDVPQPYCPSSNTRINGVDYYVWNGNPDSNLKPGIHCLKNGINKGTYTGTGVLFVLLDGGIKMTGNDGFNVTRASNIIDKNGNQYGGMLFYVPKSNTNELKFGGNQNTKISGTIFAPGAECDIAGTADAAAFQADVICNKVRVHGNPDIYISYKEPQNFPLPPLVELTQ